MDHDEKTTYLSEAGTAQFGNRQDEPPTNQSQQAFSRQENAPTTSICGTIRVTGQATAILGNVNGNLYVNNEFVLSAPSNIPPLLTQRQRIERCNRIFANYTLETITVSNDGDAMISKSASYQKELKWWRREDVGEGVFGEVHREECLDAAVVKSRAVKVLRIRQLKRMKINYKKEIGALLRLSQPENVHRFVEFFSWYQDASKVYLAMEYIIHGDLITHISKGLSKADTQQISYQVLDGIRILHNLDIVHRDIKPGNIFVVQYEPRWWVKIGDFGIAKSTMTELTALQTVVGTLGYQAPEILGLIPAEKANYYNEKCDIWSFGCVLYELCTGSMLFRSLCDLQTCCRSGIFALLPPDLGEILTDFLHSLLQCSSAGRPSAEEALEVGIRWFQLDTMENANEKQESTQTIPPQQQRDFGKTLWQSNDLMEQVGRISPSNRTTQETTEISVSSFYSRQQIGLDVADIICILEACSPAAASSVQATSLIAPQHILQDTDFHTFNSQNTTAMSQPVKIAPKIALRLSSIVKSPKQGFKFGRNSRSCDILLTGNRWNRVVSNTHFTIFVDESARLTIEDCSTNGTLFDDELLSANEQKYEHHTKPRRILQNGSLIGVSVGGDREQLKFLVRIPKRMQYDDIYALRLEKYLQARNIDD